MMIRQQQLTAFSDMSLSRFVERVAAHLHRCFPDECQALGPDGVQNTIQYGIERARAHGIKLERDVCKYIDLMIAFGRDFDRNPYVPWASRILEDDRIKDPSIKTDRLFNAAKLQTELP